MEDKNRHFTRQFKRDAVQLVTEKGLPLGKVAREFDIPLDLLHSWGRNFPPHKDNGIGIIDRQKAE